MMLMLVCYYYYYQAISCKYCTPLKLPLVFNDVGATLSRTCCLSRKPNGSRSSNCVLAYGSFLEGDLHIPMHYVNKSVPLPYHGWYFTLRLSVEC